MKRALTSVLLGPPPGFAVFLLYGAVVSGSVPSLGYLVFTPWAYVVGGVPAAVAAAVARLALTAIDILLRMRVRAISSYLTRR